MPVHTWVCGHTDKVLRKVVAGKLLSDTFIYIGGIAWAAAGGLHTRMSCTTQSAAAWGPVVVSSSWWLTHLALLASNTAVLLPEGSCCLGQQVSPAYPLPSLCVSRSGSDAWPCPGLVGPVPG